MYSPFDLVWLFTLCINQTYCPAEILGIVWLFVGTSDPLGSHGMHLLLSIFEDQLSSSPIFPCSLQPALAGQCLTVVQARGPVPGSHIQSPLLLLDAPVTSVRLLDLVS